MADDRLFSSDPSRNTIRAVLGGRRALWLGFLAVLLPLMVMLGLQYWWLVDLEEASLVARQAALENYLDFVVTQTEWRYTQAAEKILHVPASLFEQDDGEWLSHFRESIPVPDGSSAWQAANDLRFVFLLSFRKPFPWRTFFYDPQTGTESDSAPVSAHLATLYWESLAQKGKAFSAPSEPIVDERDPENPIILRVFADPQTSQLIGIAGLVVDVREFRENFLNRIIRKALSKYTNRRDLAVSVRDGNGREILSHQGLEGAAGNEVLEIEKRFTFIFTDWVIGLGSRGLSSAQLARWNFVFNVTLALTLAAVLLGGITLALRTAAREMRLSQMKSDFVSNVSHELRTPLASIRAFGELLRLGRFEEKGKVREYGEYIETESRRLSQLIDNILDFSKIESGSKVYDFEETDLERVVEKVLRTFRMRLRNSNFEIHFTKPDTRLPPIQIDPGAIAHALGNLLDNAVKYSNGAHRVEVGLEKTQSSLRLSVTDTGVGISRPEQQRIFERFHRVGTGLVHDIKGSGLGLSIVQHIVLAHQGRVEVRSEPGRGSTFFIELPLSSKLPSPTAHSAARPGETS